jgi:hypothetical protein
MRKLGLIGGGAAAIGIAIVVTLWQTRDRAPTAPTPASARLEARSSAPAAAPPRSAAPSRAADESPTPAETAVEQPAEEIDDGDDHGHAGREQGGTLPLEEAPPSRDAFGADPQSEAAALAEARATLEALLNDPDPAVQEQASAVLATIAAQ